MSKTGKSCWQKLSQYNTLLWRYRKKGRELSDLLTDLKFEEENKKIYFIVDFSEIYMLSSIDRHNDKEGLTRKETLATLLYGNLPCYGTPVLINPYRTEFKRKMKKLKKTIKSKKKQTDESVKLEDEKFKIIKDKLLQISSESEISQKDRDDIINTLKKFGLYDLLSGRSKAILDLLEKCRELIDVNTLSPYIRRISLTIHPNIANSDYFRALLILDELTERFNTLNDYIDSQALELIDLVNSKENNAILLFYSGSHHMKNLLGRGIKFDPPIEKREIPLGESYLYNKRETLNFLRTPDMIAEYFYALKEKKSREGAIRLLEAKNNKISEIVGMGIPIENILKICPKNPKKCKNRILCQKKLKKIEEEIRHHNKLINTVDICETFTNYSALFEIAKKSLKSNEEIIRILLEHREEIEEFFQEQKALLLKNVNELFDRLNNHFIELFQFESFDKLKIRLGRIRGRPYYIFFHNKFIIDKINDLITTIEETNKKEKDLEKIKKKYIEFLNCIVRKDLDHERYLLLAVLMFAHSYYDEVIDLSQEKMDNLSDKDDTYREFCLINILSNYRKYLREKQRIYGILARDRCKKFCKIYEDPRYYNALGVIQLSLIKSEGKDIDKIIELEILPNYKKALQCLEKSEKNFGDLTVVLKNNIADAILEKEKISSEELKKVEKMIEEIKDEKYFFIKHTIAKLCERKFEKYCDEKYFEKGIKKYDEAICLASEEEIDRFIIEKMKEDQRKFSKNLSRTLIEK